MTLIFPILIITPGGKDGTYKAQIVYKKDLNSFIENNQEYTYLVPEDSEGRRDKEILQFPRSGDQWHAAFTVEESVDGRRSAKVECTWDDDRVNIGWYEATDKEIFPKHYQFYFGPGLVMRAFPIAFALDVTVWVAVFVARRRSKKRRINSISIDPAP